MAAAGAKGTMVARRFARALAACAFAVLPCAVQSAPAPGSLIANQASATGVIGTTPLASSSNVVTVTAASAPVGNPGGVLATTTTLDAEPGATVNVPHTLTNTAASPDTFTLSVQQLPIGGYTFAAMALFADANGDGQPDGTAPITGPVALAAGQVFRFVAQLVVPLTAPYKAMADVRIAASSLGGALVAPITDRVIVQDLRVPRDCATVGKMLSRESGASPFAPVRVTLSYSACDKPRAQVTLTDRLPAGMRYVAASGRSSETGGTVLTDRIEGANDQQGSGASKVAYDFGATVGGAVTATVFSIPAGGAGWVSFEVEIEAGLAVGTVIPNSASYTFYDAGGAPGHQGGTNVASYRVTGSADFDLAGERLATVVPGTTAVFRNVLRNRGDFPDTFDITVSGSTFPAGTTFQLFRGDGVTPLSDTDGSGTADTGVVAAQGSATIVLRARIPATAEPGAYRVTKTARSAASPSRTASADDIVDTVSTRCVASLDPDNSAQVGFGQRVTYTHWLTNNGNCRETVRATVEYLRDSQAGWTSKVFIDNPAGGNGSLPGAPDATDVPVAAGWSRLLAPGDSLRLLVEVSAPSRELFEAQHAGGGKQVVHDNVTTLVLSSEASGPLTVRDTTYVDDKEDHGTPQNVIRNFPDGRYSAPTLWAPVGGQLWLRADANACNADPATVETRSVVLVGRNGDRETVTATETGPNTGIFTVPAMPARAPPIARDDGIVQGRAHDTFEMEILGCGRRIANVVTLMEPAGVVFDTTSNEPVAGASVTLLATAGGRCTTSPASLGTGVPNPVVTGADGRFSFPALAAGRYCLGIRGLNGYQHPSTVPWHLLPRDRTIHANGPTTGGSYGDVFEVAAGGLVAFDLPVDPSAQSGLFVQKAASRAVAEVGEMVDYTVRVRNGTGNALHRGEVTLADDLPAGFTYAMGSARLDGRVLADPAGGVGPRVTFSLGTLDRGAEAVVTYRVRLGPGALQGDGVNRVQASYRTNGTTTVSNVAIAKVEVTGGVFTSKGFILGKVFLDCNSNGVQDAGEAGVPGVRMVLEDGTFLFTDGGGKFSFYGITNRTHVVKADRTTLPLGARLSAISARHLGDGGSRIVDLKSGEMHRADFAIAGCEPGIADEVKKRAERLAKRADEIALAGAQLATEARTITDPRALPASGVMPAVPQGVPAANALPQDGVADASGVKGNGAATAASAAPTPSPALPHALSFAGARGGGRSASLESLVPDLDSELAFVGVKDGDTMAVAQATVRVKGRAGAAFELSVNGERVADSHIGKRAVLEEKQVQAWEYFGVPLAAGDNTLLLVQRDPFGNERGRQSIRVVAPGSLAKIGVELPAAAVADGRTPARVVVTLTDGKGVPVTSRTPVTLEASRGAWDGADIDPTEPGLQAMVENGRGEFALVAPVEPGQSRIVVTSGKVTAEARLDFMPELRNLIATGVLEGIINVRKLSQSAIVPARRDDGFEQELRQLSRSSGDGKREAGARLAFFLKGKVRGEYLLTAAYDSDKDTRERLFRDIQPDEFYPVYGDSAVRGYDAQSTAKLYVRVDHRKSYLLYGDFNTLGDTNVRKLSGYSRSLTGLRHHYESGRVTANVFASRDSTRQKIDEIRANGTSGPYELSSPLGLVNSEKVEILTRDRDRPALILQSVPQARFYDYEMEPLTGRILFKAPVPSVDQDLNPITIRVTYEVDQGGPDFWIFGGDAEVKVTDRIAVGASFAEDRNPADPFKLRGAHALVRIGEKTSVAFEYAHTERPVTAKEGDAGRVHVRHDGERLKAEAFVARTDPTFDNPGAYLGQGRGEAGARASFKVDEKTTLRAEALRTEDSANHNVRDGYMVSAERAFDEKYKVEVGVRHAREEGGPAILPNITGPGSEGIPREVTSVRARVTAPVPKVADATVYGEVEVDTSDADRKVVAIGGEYAMPKRGRIYARHEFISSLTGPYGLNGEQRQNTTVLGVDTEYMKDARLFSEYRIRDALSGGDAEAAIGLRNLWTLSEGWRLGTTFERVEALSGTGQNENTAVALALEYVGSPLWKGSTRIEVRDAATAQSLLHTIGFASRVSREWTLLARNTLSIQKNKASERGDAGERVLDRLQAGVAWRDADTDKVNALARIEHRTERDDTQPGIALRRTIELFSLHADWKPRRPFLVTGHYAAKWAKENSNGLATRYRAQLASGRLTWEFAPRWDVGLAASGLFGEGAKSRQYGLGLEIGYLLATNLWVSAGYNVYGFEDADLTAGEYTQKGAYVRLRYKFDEALFGQGGEGAK